MLLTCVTARATAQALSPEEALKHFQTAEGFEVKLVASEPDVRQPVTMTFDDRGRIWVIQYLQYPNPAGLKPVTVDRYLRTKYDRRPEPPPHGPRGADKITILEDTDGDGRMDRAKDFVTGLNLASALALGDGGVYVGQAPYLLFYPDRDHDDLPDGDPEVLLTGFGLEDAHAVVNSLQWGPDGWLYGAQGSTVTADVRGIGFQQGIWRYHPPTKRFELFSEGGGNTWGLDFDRAGNVIAGTNWGDAVCLHQVQGGYYVKGFSKHGPLHNPYTYGYFDHVKHSGHVGGHVTCGGIVYQADLFPAAFRDCYLGPNLLSNEIYWHRFERAARRSRRTTRARSSRPTTPGSGRSIRLIGPDGALYVVDWYDQRANHVIPEDTWDKTNGRIWQVAPRGAAPLAAFDLSKLTNDQLIERLGHANAWHCREARRILRERHDAASPAALDRARQTVGRRAAGDRSTVDAVLVRRLERGAGLGAARSSQRRRPRPGRCVSRATRARRSSAEVTRPPGAIGRPRTPARPCAANWPARPSDCPLTMACRLWPSFCAMTRTPPTRTFRCSSGGPSKTRPRATAIRF